MKLPPPTLLVLIIPLLLVIGKYEPDTTELRAKQVNQKNILKLDVLKYAKK